MSSSAMLAKPSVVETPDSRRISLMHRAREQEISIIFEHTPERAFAAGLELGAGDCYQSQFLKRYVGELTCSDLDDRLLDRRDPGIRYMQCDAEQVDRVFAARTFDLVFSSNMLTHTPDQHAVLTGVAKILAEQGVLIIVAPSPLWKIFKLAAFYPRLALNLPGRLLRKLNKPQPAVAEPEIQGQAASSKAENNLKAIKTYSRFRKLLFPIPIGIYSSNTAEILGSRKHIWVEKFRRAGWELISIKNGPFICGDLSRRLNDVLAKLGLSTEYIYVVKKAGQSSRFEGLFR